MDIEKNWRILPIAPADSQLTLKEYSIKKCTGSYSFSPEINAEDSLTELFRKGIRDLIAEFVKAELETLLGEHSSHRLEDGRVAVARNGYLPGRTIQTGFGDV